MFVWNKLGWSASSRLCIVRAAVNVLFYIRCLRARGICVSANTAVTGLAACCLISSLGIVKYECHSMPPMSLSRSRALRAT